MSDVITAAMAALADKAASYEGVAKFVIPGEGTIMMSDGTVRAADEEADVTLTATAKVFQAILTGEMNPTTAFMTGKLKIDGSMGQAMKLASVLG